MQSAREGEHRAAGAEPQHGHADGHIGEMVKLLDRESSNEQNLVGERCCREECHGDGSPESCHGVRRRPLNIGTKRTGRRLRVRTFPFESFSTKMRLCTP